MANVAWGTVITMNEVFQEFAGLLRAHGVEAEAVLDASVEVCALCFYVDGQAFTVQPHRLDDGQIRLALESLEIVEDETAQERLDHVLEVLRRTDPRR